MERLMAEERRGGDKQQTLLSCDKPIRYFLKLDIKLCTNWFMHKLRMSKIIMAKLHTK